MNSTKIILGALVGAVVAFFLGYLLYGLLLADFFESNMGSATGVMRSDEEMSWLPLIAGHLTYGLLIAIIFGRWAGIKTVETGAKAGAVIGLLIGATTNLMNLGTTHITSGTSALVDVGVMLFVGACVGGAVGWYFGRE